MSYPKHFLQFGPRCRISEWCMTRVEKRFGHYPQFTQCMVYVYIGFIIQAQILVSDLTWLNTEFYERWRRIIFTSTSPVSWRWKVYMRLLFIISFLVCARLFWIALIGAYRAHRHRLVWGEKLMS